MKRWIFVLFFSLIAPLAHSQIAVSASGTATERFKTIQGFQVEAGAKITINEFRSNPVTGKSAFAVDCDGKTDYIDPANAKSIAFDVPATGTQLWQNIKLKSDLYQNLAAKGLQFGLRRDLEDDTTDSLSYFQKNVGFFKDDYLEDYLQSLLHKIHSVTLNDTRPGNLAIRILKDSSPNAYSAPTGTKVITTGLLSTIRSEDELLGVLTHEVAHFVLDHQVVNINKANDRKKRAEFWSGLATVVAAASEVYLASKKGIELDGSLTLSTAVLSTSIASAVLERLGANYSREQEKEADQAAIMILEFLKRNPKALSAALMRIRDYCILNGDYLALSGAGTHPALHQRIADIGPVDPETFNSPKHDRLISMVNTYNAAAEYSLKHLMTTLQLTSRNIDAGVATEEDYLLKGMVVRALYDTQERNQEALDLIVRARTLNMQPDFFPEIYKQEGLTLLRLSRKQDAVNALQTYLQKIEAFSDPSQQVLEEIIWTRKTIYKIKSS